MDASIERHPDDLSPDDLPPDPGLRPRVPRGVLWALALLVVVLVIMSWVAMSTPTATTASGGAGSSSGEVVRLGPGATMGLPGANPLLGQPAPDVSYERFTGGTGELSELRGRPTVINFWASDCTPCITEMPAFERVHRRLGDRVAFLGLDVERKDEAARRMAEQTGVTYPLAFDRDGINQRFAVMALPTTIMIDRTGTIVLAHTGEMKEDELDRHIKELLQP